MKDWSWFSLILVRAAPVASMDTCLLDEAQWVHHCIGEERRWFHGWRERPSTGYFGFEHCLEEGRLEFGGLVVPTGEHHVKVL